MNSQGREVNTGGWTHRLREMASVDVIVKNLDQRTVKIIKKARVSDYLNALIKKNPEQPDKCLAPFFVHQKACVRAYEEDTDDVANI